MQSLSFDSNGGLRMEEAKPYFIGQGTSIVKSFDTLEEMLDFHSKMSDLDRHFCKLYDRNKKQIADGNDIIFDRGWRAWT